MELNGAIKPQRRVRPSRRRRLFTLEHANRTLPLVRRVVADIVKQYKKVSALEERCHMRRPSVSREQQENLSRQYAAELGRLRDLSEELSAIGCEIKDWRRGLVDFCTLYEGREVELCWHLGEDRIGYWHEVGAGFAARRPIDANFVGQIMENTALV